MKLKFRHKDSGRQGLSLAEIAIVLGIMGVVTYGVWSTVTQGWEQTHREQAEEALMGIVRDTRAYYSGQVGIPDSISYKIVTDNLLRRHAIPANLLRNPDCRSTNGATCIADTPWGGYVGNSVAADGTLRVCGWELGNTDDPCVNLVAYGAPQQFFGVGFVGLKLGSCIALAGKISSTMGPPGLIEVNINGCNLSSGTGGCAKGSASIQPVPAQNLNAECARTTPAHVTFVYRMTLPTN